MASSGGAFSQTLQDITNTKLEELAKKRTLFEQRKASSLQDAERQERSLDTLEKLAEGCKQCFGISTSEGKVVRGSSSHPDLENDLRNLQRIINQARFDPSVSQRIVEQWRAKLLRYLDVQSLKYQYADLYGKLTVEWLQSSAPQVKSKSIDQLGDTDEFERVSVKAKLQAKQNWEHDVFEDHDVNETAINEYLTRLFDSKGSDAALNRIRTSISTVESGLSTPNQFNTATLHWTLKSLLASDRLTNEKRQVIRDFQSNNVILTEIADVLNMRLAAVDNWSVSLASLQLVFHLSNVHSGDQVYL